MKYYFDITTAQYAGSKAIGTILREEIVRNWFTSLDKALTAHSRAEHNLHIGHSNVGAIVCPPNQEKTVDPTTLLGPDDGREPFAIAPQSFADRAIERELLMLHPSFD